MSLSQREIFSIVGLPPEVLAVAMAKYSRSQKSIKETIDELTEEKSAEFHEKWVLGYGDASVADMAIIAMALEGVSILASKVIEDNRLASYQEKSTRYVPFDRTRYARPEHVLQSSHGVRYTETVETLMNAYETTVKQVSEYYRGQYPKPDTMTDKAYEARLRARALDVARYLLPTATFTNFGMIMSARSLRHCISKLLGHPLRECKEIGREIQQAAVEPAYNPQAAKIEPLLQGTGDVLEGLRAAIKLQIKGAPTLIKHTEPKEYLRKKDEVMHEFAAKYFTNLGPDENELRVDFITERLDPTDELVATLFYPHLTTSFRSILERVQTLPADEKSQIIAAVQQGRSPHDWPSREFEVPGAFIFDTLFDYGAFRDIQRHRLMTQINQPLSIVYGYEIPRDLEVAGGLSRYREMMELGKTRYATLRTDFPEEARYVIPMAYRKRTLMKMNLREFHHLVELRSRSGGHFSYRDLVYEMYEKVRAVYPSLVSHLRVVKMDFDADFFGR